MNDKKLTKRQSLLVALAIMIVSSVGFAFAYFTAQVSGDKATSLSATSKESTTLVFNKGDDIILDASLDNFYDGAGTLTSTTNPSVTLTSPDEYTANYNVYFEIASNTFIYTTEEEYPELLLRVYDENGVEVKSIAGLEYIEGDEPGFDITTKEGLFVIDTSNMITTDSETIEEWEFSVFRL